MSLYCEYKHVGTDRKTKIKQATNTVNTGFCIIYLCSISLGYMYDCMYHVRMHVLMCMQLCIILRKNPTNALTYVLTPLYSHCYTAHVSALKGPSSGSTDTFCEHGQPNTCPGVNIRLKSSVLDVTWQLSERY
jgi:hypothetical protein